MAFERGRFYSSSRNYTDGQNFSFQRQYSGGDKRHSTWSQTKPGSIPTRLSKMFKKENAGRRGLSSEKTRTPPGFSDMDSSDALRPCSPESSPPVGNFTRNRIRSHSVGSRVAMKVRKGKERDDIFFMWKPVRRKRCEWESISGRQLTIKDTHISKLSKVELDALQQLAISHLQALDITVSKNSIRSGKLKIVKRKSSNERPLSSAVFGQPLTAVLNQDKSRAVATSPIRTCSFSTGSSPGTPLTDHSHPDQPIASPSCEISESIKSPLNKLKRQASVLPVPPQVPLLVRKTIEHLDNNGIKTEGLFRVPGAKARIDMIKQKFDSGEDVELTDDMSPHDVACVFKEFFRSLPEPLMTRELYYPFLKTRKISTRAQQKNALRYLVILLPRPNRDTLQELLQFLCKVALHSDGIILVDGTEESGNRMTEENLATVFGPNILHNESRSKSPQQSYSVMKQDPEELTFVCQVMTDLIRMQDAIFTIPAELYDATLQHLFSIDHEAVDFIMRQKCLELEQNPESWEDNADIDQANYSEPNLPSSTSNSCSEGLSTPITEPAHNCAVPRSHSSDHVKKMAVVDPTRLSTLTPPNDHQSHPWQRSHSFNMESERLLDDAMKNLEEMLSEGLTMSNHRRHSSNDSAMGESECVTSPCQNPEVIEVIASSSANDDPSMYNSVDSAISNHSPHHSSSEEGGAHIEWLEEVDPSHFEAFPMHTHTFSGISAHSESPTLASPLRVHSPKGLVKSNLSNTEYSGSLPVLNPVDNTSLSSFSHRSSSPFSLTKKALTNARSIGSHSDLPRPARKGHRNKKRKKQGSIDDNMPSYDPERSPILRRISIGKPNSTAPTDYPSSAPPTTNMATTTALSDISPRFHYIIQSSSEVLI